jgi:hypothetical protein
MMVAPCLTSSAAASGFDRSQPNRNAQSRMDGKCDPSAKLKSGRETGKGKLTDEHSSFTPSSLEDARVMRAGLEVIPLWMP